MNKTKTKTFVVVTGESGPREVSPSLAVALMDDALREELTPDVCYHCALTMDADECGNDAEVQAVWVDADGNGDGVIRRICRECFLTGEGQRPGFALA